MLLSSLGVVASGCKSTCPLRGDSDSAFCPAPRQFRSENDFNRRYPCSEAGRECPLPNECARGEVVCLAGVGRCALKDARASGSACEGGGICDGLGHCLGCRNEGAPCRPVEACRQGKIRCDGGEAPRCEPVGTTDSPCGDGICDASGVCVEAESEIDLCANAALGTPCGEGGFCDGVGVCVQCSQNVESEACNPGGACHHGLLRCVDGLPACVIASPREIGEACGKSGHCSLFGRCSGSCGDGYIDAYLGETCDDGNQIDGDGCSADCRSSECGFQADASLRFRRLKGSCYWRGFDSVSRTTAIGRCEEGGGHLIRWDGNPGISVGVYSLVNPSQSDGESRVWIGLQWSREEQEWQWDNGVAASARELQWQTYDRKGHASTKPSSPIASDGTRSESCVEWGGRGFATGPHQRGNQLNDISCESTRHYVCARPPSGVFREEQ